MSIKGYYVLDHTGKLVDQIKGTVLRKILNKHRAYGRSLRKIKFGKKS